MTDYNNRERRDYTVLYTGIVMLVAMGMLTGSAYCNYQRKIEKAQKLRLEQIILKKGD